MWVDINQARQKPIARRRKHCPGFSLAPSLCKTVENWERYIKLILISSLQFIQSQQELRSKMFLIAKYRKAEYVRLPRAYMKI